MTPAKPFISLDYFREDAIKRACSYWSSPCSEIIGFEESMNHTVNQAEIHITAEDEMNRVLVELQKRNDLPVNLPGVLLIDGVTGKEIAVCFYYHPNE